MPSLGSRTRIFFSVCPTLWGGGVRISGWVGFQPPPPPSSPRRVGHCGGLWVSTKGAGQGILPVVRHFACGSWVDGWVGEWVSHGDGTFVGFWVCQKSVVGGSLKSPPTRG